MAILTTFASIAKNLQAMRLRQFEFAVNRSFLQIQGALAENLQKEISRIRRDRSDTALRPLEDTIESLFQRKEANAVLLANVNTAVGKLTDIQTRLYELRNAVQAGSRTLFDAALSALADDAWTSIGRSDNLIGFLGDSTIGARTAVAGDRGEIVVGTQYLGSSYSIKLDDGRTASPDLRAQTLNIDGTKIDFSALTLISRTGNDVQFSDGTTTYTGTIARGGLGILSSWLYGGDFTNQAEAAADVVAGDAIYRTVDFSLRTGQSQLKALVGRATVDIDAANRQYQTKLDTIFDTRTAEIKAAQSRVDIANFNLSITAKLQLAYVTNMFTDHTPQKKTLFQVLAGS